jgi:hypothetical protein
MSCFSRSAGIAVFLGFLALSGQWLAAAPQASSAQNPPLLPPVFGGWQMQGSLHISKDPAAADPSNAAVLKEYRFADFASATYTRDDGRTLKIRGARFADASGAFGAYTFYLQPEMNREQIGDQGASLGGKRVLFYRGDVLIDAVFSQESAMSGAELRELAGDLPLPAGSAGNLPTFLEFMPRRGYIANTQKYVMGPAALASLAAPVSAGLVDFGSSSEAALGRYNTPSGEATLMLISYPTPQLAADHLRRIDAAEHQAPSQPGVAIINSAGPLSYKRTGPLLAIVAGPVSESDAKTLLGSVNYEASVTWNEPGGQHDVKDLYLLIVNVVIICAIIGGLAIVAGVAFGGFRILMKRWFPDKVFDRPEQMEFISLHLTETLSQDGSPDAPEGGPGVPAKRS